MGMLRAMTKTMLFIGLLISDHPFQLLLLLLNSYLDHLLKNKALMQTVQTRTQTAIIILTEIPPHHFQCT